MRQPVVYVVDGALDDTEDMRSLLASANWRVEYFRSGMEFLALMDHQGSACLLLDLRVEDMSGLDVLAALRKRGCEIPTIIIASCADVPSAVKAMQAGAIDLLERPVRRADIVNRIKLALDVARKQQETQSRRADLELRWSRLTQGERFVAQMICAGRSSREIGEELQLGRRTIENRRANIMAKMGAGSLAELVRIICGAGPGFPPPEQENGKRSTPKAEPSSAPQLNGDLIAE
jgi:FixJ family two-component response regulator